MKNKTIYLLSPNISWKTFKMLQDKLVKDSGPKPLNGDKMLWAGATRARAISWRELFIFYNNRVFTAELSMRGLKVL